MTFTPLTLNLNEYGILSGQLYQPEALSEKQLGPSANFRKDARLVILLHGWGADGSDLAPLAPSLLSPTSVAFEDISPANHASFGSAVFVPDAPNICSANPYGRQWFELSDPCIRHWTECISLFADSGIYCGHARRFIYADWVCFRSDHFGGLLARWHGITHSWSWL